MSAPPPYDVLAGALRQLAADRGPEVWRDPLRLTGMLLDQQPELRREIRCLATAVDLGVPQALAACQADLAPIVIDRQIALVESEAHLQPDAARCVVGAIAHALGRGPLPGRAAPAAPRDQPAPPALGNYPPPPGPGPGRYPPPPQPEPPKGVGETPRRRGNAALIGVSAVLVLAIAAVLGLWLAGWFGGRAGNASGNSVRTATTWLDGRWCHSDGGSMEFASATGTVRIDEGRGVAINRPFRLSGSMLTLGEGLNAVTGRVRQVDSRTIELVSPAGPVERMERC